jgi:broad specificity phosphatase PhoE
MKLHRIRTLTLAAALLAPYLAFAEPTIIYLVRHGEKEAVGKDPALTAQGQARAQNIATILQKAGIGSIFSSTTMRTRQTAAPLAQRSGLPVQGYDPSAPEALVEKVKALNGAVLIVGHSNTVPDRVRMFGGAPGADVADNEFDRLYQLIRGANSTLTTVPLTPPPPASGPAQ